MRYARLLPLLLLVAAGCDRSPPALAPARGHISVDGRPLRGGTVVFTPDAQRGTRGPISFAEIDVNGSFVLASDSGPGAIAGWHRVTIAPPPDMAALVAGLERYRHPDHSGLQYEVKVGQDNEFKIALELEP